MSTIAVVGLGLVGGSVARALVGAGDVVLGVDPDAGTRSAARAAGIEAFDDVRALAGRSPEVVVLAVPLRAMAATAEALAGVVGPEAVVTDVGSVKGPVRAAVEAAGLGVQFVGAHPMAGTERSGFGASSAALVRGARWAVTVDDGAVPGALATRPDALATVLALVTGPLAGTASVLTDAVHDAAVALVSHVPHVLATSLLTQVEHAEVQTVALGLAAGSFRDGTRVGRTDPRRTEAMVVDNAPHVGPVLRTLAHELVALADRLDAGEPVAEFFDAPDAVRARLDARDARSRDGADLPAEEKDARARSDVGPAQRETVTLDGPEGVRALLRAGRAGAVVERVLPGSRVVLRS